MAKRLRAFGSVQQLHMQMGLLGIRPACVVHGSNLGAGGLIVSCLSVGARGDGLAHSLLLGYIVYCWAMPGLFNNHMQAASRLFPSRLWVRARGAAAGGALLVVNPTVHYALCARTGVADPHADAQPSHFIQAAAMAAAAAGGSASGAQRQGRGRGQAAGAVPRREALGHPAVGGGPGQAAGDADAVEVRGAQTSWRS